jgi:hypothetical protein
LTERKGGGSPRDGTEGREKVGDGGGTRGRSYELAFQLHYSHGRRRQICTYPKFILNPIVMLLFSDEFAISSNKLPYLKFNNRFATITNSLAKL